MQLLVAYCPECNCPRFFAPGAPLPRKVECTNIGFRLVEQDVSGPPTFGCPIVYDPAIDLQTVYLSAA